VHGSPQTTPDGISGQALSLANASDTTPRIRDLHPLEKNSHSLLPDCKKNLYFSYLIRAYNKCALLLMQGAHSVYKPLLVAGLLRSAHLATLVYLDK